MCYDYPKFGRYPVVSDNDMCFLNSFRTNYIVLWIKSTTLCFLLQDFCLYLKKGMALMIISDKVLDGLLILFLLFKTLIRGDTKHV